MRFLLDACAGGTLVTWLRERGHDAIRVQDRDDRMKDSDVLAWAYDEGRVVITTDKDFGELAVALGQPHCGIVRLPDVPRATRFDLMAQLLDRYDEEIRDGAILTVGLTRVRVRYS